jgi:hypothetical protein
MPVADVAIDGRAPDHTVVELRPSDLMGIDKGQVVANRGRSSLSEVMQHQFADFCNGIETWISEQMLDQANKQQRAMEEQFASRASQDDFAALTSRVEKVSGALAGKSDIEVAARLAELTSRMFERVNELCARVEQLAASQQQIGQGSLVESIEQRMAAVESRLSELNSDAVSDRAEIVNTPAQRRDAVLRALDGLTRSRSPANCVETLHNSARRASENEAEDPGRQPNAPLSTHYAPAADTTLPRMEDSLRYLSRKLSELGESWAA